VAPTILVIEDEAGLASAVQAYLERQGAAVRVFGTVLSAQLAPLVWPVSRLHAATA